MEGLRGFAIAVLLVACGSVSNAPDAAPPDANPPGAIQLTGGWVGVFGVRPAALGGMQVVEDGFEINGWSCGSQLCVGGGLRP